MPTAEEDGSSIALKLLLKDTIAENGSRGVKIGLAASIDIGGGTWLGSIDRD